METITSLQNPKIKRLVRLREKSSFRKSEGVFIIEGLREIILALQSGYQIEELYIWPEVVQGDVLANISEAVSETKRIETSKNVYQKIAVRESTEGLLAVARPKSHTLSDLKVDKDPLILVVEKVEKPGNLGALFRTADAAAIDAVIICDPRVDLYSPNVIRAALGCLFTLQVAVAESEEVLQWLEKNAIQTFAATPDGAVVYHSVNYTGASAIVVGSEADGLSGTWMNKAGTKVLIPMRGGIDSLNVSVSAAVIVFEAVRQREIAN
ncbi:MAG: RNA methyltransferase [Bacteroidales bacterium]|nr:RNA methyltransferase [Bacteroidales bacterium]